MEKKSVKVIMIHGNGGGTGEDHWFPYVKKELEKLGLPVVAKTFPDNELARQSYWLPFLKNELKADENTILIGHSSGAVAALRFAEKNKILGSVLVSVNYTDLGDEKEKKSGYYDHPWDWNAIKKNQRWIVQFASSDDPWIPIEEARFISAHLASELHEFKDQGHFGLPKPKSTFPEIVQAVRSKLRSEETIDISYWSKVKLKTGKIVEVEKVPQRDRLYKLQVDIGLEKPIQIVSGIVPFYTAEQLVGKTIVVFVNLKPATIAGEVSQGMLLAAEGDKEQATLLTTDRQIEPGSSVR